MKWGHLDTETSERCTHRGKTLWRHGEKVAICEPRTEASEETNLLLHLDPQILVFWTEKQISVVKPTELWCIVMQPELTDPLLKAPSVCIWQCAWALSSGLSPSCLLWAVSWLMALKIMWSPCSCLLSLGSRHGQPWSLLCSQHCLAQPQDLWLWCAATGTEGQMNSSCWSETMGAKSCKRGAHEHQAACRRKSLTEDSVETWNYCLFLSVQQWRKEEASSPSLFYLHMVIRLWTFPSWDFPWKQLPLLRRYPDVPFLHGALLPLVVLHLFPGLSRISRVNAAKSLRCWTTHLSGLCEHSCGWRWHLVPWRPKISKQENYQGIMCWEIRWENETAID